MTTRLHSISLFASGAVLLGFVAQRVARRRPRAVDLRKLARPERARTDTLRSRRFEPETTHHDELDPLMLDRIDEHERSKPPLGPSIHPVLGDEDGSIEPEDWGAEWLSRATETTFPVRSEAETLNDEAAGFLSENMLRTADGEEPDSEEPDGEEPDTDLDIEMDLELDLGAQVSQPPPKPRP